MFGPKGAGKNACAESLLPFFGLRGKVPNLHNTSKPALADHVATSCNALCVFDEYRNDLEMEKREFLKGLWDGIGRTRMNMDKDKKKETTSVDQGIIVCGQQMATADIALMSRFIVLAFNQVEFSQKEKNNFVELQDILKRGITHLTHQILRQRSSLETRFKKEVELCEKDIDKLLGKQTVETRILNNWLCVLAVYRALHTELDFGWDYQETLSIAVELMVKQNNEIKKSDDIGQFWKVVEYLIHSNMLFDGGDFKSAYVNTASRIHMLDGKWINDKIQWHEAKNVLWLTTSRVFSLYKQQCAREGDKALPDSTIEHYLKNSKAFLFTAKKEGFMKIDPKTGLHETGNNGRKKRTCTSALVFDLKLLPFGLPSEEDGVQATLPPAEPGTPEAPNVAPEIAMPKEDENPQTALQI